MTTPHRPRPLERGELSSPNPRRPGTPGQLRRAHYARLNELAEFAYAQTPPTAPTTVQQGRRLGALVAEAAPAGDPWAATAGTLRPPPLCPDPARRSHHRATRETTDD